MTTVVLPIQELLPTAFRNPEFVPTVGVIKLKVNGLADVTGEPEEPILNPPYEFSCIIPSTVNVLAAE